MAILSGIAVLHCRSIEDTLAFYQQLLQFVVVNKRELEGELVWVHLMHGDTTLMLQASEQKSTESSLRPSSNISLYFFVNDIQALHHFIKAKHNALTAMQKADYKMQEFTLLDPEGNTITVGQKA